MRLIFARTDVDNRDRPPAVSIFHTDSGGTDTDCGLLLREPRCSVCVCVFALSCVRESDGRMTAGSMTQSSNAFLKSTFINHALLIARLKCSSMCVSIHAYISEAMCVGNRKDQEHRSTSLSSVHHYCISCLSECVCVCEYVCYCPLNILLIG